MSRFPSVRSSVLTMSHLVFLVGQSDAGLVSSGSCQTVGRVPLTRELDRLHKETRSANVTRSDCWFSGGVRLWTVSYPGVVQPLCTGNDVWVTREESETPKEEKGDWRIVTPGSGSGVRYMHTLHRSESRGC